ncbi:MAG: hypothetical protein ACR2K3_02865 [Nocardioides sp.]
MSRPVVYVHIGAPKTGTTYLQDRLTRNARSLARHGVHVPTGSVLVSPALFQFRAALDLLEQDWGGPTGHAAGSWPALVKRVRRKSGTVVVSHEILAPADPAYVARLMRDLADCEVHVIYTVRDLGRQIPAAWQESIKQGRKWSYRRYLNRIRRHNPWFARAFDLPTVLETWGAELSPERVHVVTLPHGTPTPGDGLWERFCRVIGIDPAWAPVEAERDNASLGIAETQVIRRLNRRMDRATRRESTYDQLIRGMLARGSLLDRSSAPVLLPPRLLPWATERGEHWIEWVKDAGVDVVGDLDDLLPAQPVEERAYQDPDKVSSKVQLRSALDALVAMTREAASRPDPRGTLRGKVKRARDRGGS